MKEFILDFKTWRAGSNSGYCGNPQNKTGEGRTSLRNKEGFMCCLGQFATQCGFSIDEIYGHDDPSALSTYYNKPMGEFSEYDIYRESYHNTPLADECITINDDEFTTIQQKTILLTNVLAKNDIKLTVINLPS